MDGFVRERTYPKSVERFPTIKVCVNPAKDKFTLPACISSDDDTVCLFKAGTDDFELFECCGVGYVLLILTHLADDKLKRIGTDGQVFGFVDRKTVGFGHGEGDEMSHRPSDKITATFQVSVLLTVCPNDAGNVSCYRGLLGNDTNCHSR